MSASPVAKHDSPRILVVDDDPAVSEWLGNALRDAGYRVREASNGREALALMKRDQFELCITDLVMPEQEGIETIGILKREHREVKVIAISGAFDGPMLAISGKLGAAATLQKPIGLARLLETVERVLRPELE